MKKKSNVALYALLAIAIGAMIVPTVIVLGVALVPTAVAFIMERKNGYYGGLTVGAMNLAGTAPYLTDLWFHDHSVAAATAIVTSVLAWAVFNGNVVNTLGGNFTQVVFPLTVTPGLLVTGITWACVVGLLGGVFPAVRIARKPIAVALQAQ